MRLTKKEFQIQYHQMVMFADELYAALGVKRSECVDIENLVSKLGGQVFRRGELGEAEYEIYKAECEAYKFKLYIPKYISYKKEREMLAECISELIIMYGYIVNNKLWDNTDVNKNLSCNYRISALDTISIQFMKVSILLDRNLFIDKLKGVYSDGYYNLKAVEDVFSVSSEIIVLKGRLVGLFNWDL